MPVTSLVCHLCFWPTSYKSEVPRILSSGLINLLEQLMELRKTFYLLDHRFLIKEQNHSGTARRSWHTGQGMRRRRATFLCLSRCTILRISCVHWPETSPTPVLLDFYESFITESWLIKSLAIGDWFSFQPLPAPRRWGSGGTKSSNSLTTGLITLASSPHP